MKGEMSLSLNEDGRLLSVIGSPWNLGMGRLKTWSGSILARSFFSAAPDSINEPKDHPIAGIVETPYGMYKGLIQWDLDENSLDRYLTGGQNPAGFRGISKI